MRYKSSLLLCANDVIYPNDHEICPSFLMLADFSIVSCADTEVTTISGNMPVCARTHTYCEPNARIKRRGNDQGHDARVMQLYPHAIPPCVASRTLVGTI